MGDAMGFCSVQEQPDLLAAACCAASLILVPLFVIGVTLGLLAIAIGGEIADRVRGRGAAPSDFRTIARELCHGR